MKEEDIKTHFTKYSKMFTPHTFINFVTGFVLTNQEFAKFVQPEPLNVREFEDDLGTQNIGHYVPPNFLNKEKEDRLSLLHTMDTLHLMELFVLKIEKVSEQERNSIKLCPKTGKGITKCILVNIKNDAIKWMMSKIMMKIHLPNMRNYNVLNMLRFSLWGPSIFPKEAFKDLRERNPGKTNLDAVLGISAKLPEDILGTNAETDSKALEPLTKKRKSNYQTFQTQSYQEQTRR